MRARDHRVLHREDRRPSLLVDHRERGPGAAHFHRVHHDVVRHERFELADVVAVLHPPVDERAVHRHRTGAALGDDAHHPVDHVRVPFVVGEQQVRVAGLIAPVRLDVVVQAQHRGRGPTLHDPPHRVECLDETAEAVCGAARRLRHGMGRSRAPVMMPSVPSIPRTAA